MLTRIRFYFITGFATLITVFSISTDGFYSKLVKALPKLLPFDYPAFRGTLNLWYFSFSRRNQLSIAFNFTTHFRIIQSYFWINKQLSSIANSP